MSSSANAASTPSSLAIIIELIAIAVNPFVIAAYDILIAEADPISVPKFLKSSPVEFNAISSSAPGPDTYKRGLWF